MKAQSHHVLSGPLSFFKVLKNASPQPRRRSAWALKNWNGPQATLTTAPSLAFRIRHGSARGPMSRKFYFTMKKQGLGPRETYINNLIIITPQAEAGMGGGTSCAQRELRPRLVAQKKKWRHLRSVKSGAAAAASPKHVSKRKRAQP